MSSCSNATSFSHFHAFLWLELTIIISLFTSSPTTICLCACLEITITPFFIFFCTHLFFLCHSRFILSCIDHSYYQNNLLLRGKNNTVNACHIKIRVSFSLSQEINTSVFVYNHQNSILWRSSLDKKQTAPYNTSTYKLYTKKKLVLVFPRLCERNLEC